MVARRPELRLILAAGIGLCLDLAGCATTFDDPQGAAGGASGLGGSVSGSAGVAGSMGGNAGASGVGGMGIGGAIGASFGGVSGVGGAAGDSGAAGSGGVSGASGTAGMAGMGGAAGTAGMAGMAGDAGMAGMAGSAGMAGNGGSAGMAGNGGNAGSGGMGTPMELAQGKPVTASSEETANPAPNGNDGNVSTRWCPADEMTGYTWTVDLGAVYTLTEIQISWEFGTLYGYTLEVSDNGTTFSMLLDRSGNTSTMQTQTETVSGSGRYVRHTVTSLPNDTTWGCFTELRVFGY